MDRPRRSDDAIVHLSDSGRAAFEFAEPPEASQSLRFVKCLLAALPDDDGRALKVRRRKTVGVVAVLLALFALVMVGRAPAIRLIDGPNLLDGLSFATSSVYDEFAPKDHTSHGRPTAILFHTREDEQPWVEYDLGAVRAIHRLEVRNRTDCCEDRERLHQGLTYIARAAVPNAMLILAVLLVVMVAFWDKAARRRLAFGLTISGFWLVYLAGVGGDLFSQHRHMIPVLCIFAVLSAEGVRGLVEWGRGQTAFALVASGVALCTFFQDNQRDPEKSRAQNDTFHVGGISTGPMLRLAFADRRPLLAVDAAGCMPYFYELPCLDMLGLNDQYLGHHRPKDIGTGLVGHELGDGAYVLKRQPDIVAFAGPRGSDHPAWRGGWEMYNDAIFAKQYKLVKFKTRWPEELDASYFLRIAGRVGVRREGARITVPGYLLFAEGTVARPDPQNRIVLAVEGGVEARFAQLDLPAGHVIVSVDATGPVSSTLTWTGGTQSAVFNERVEVDLASGPASASIAVKSRDGRSITIREIRFDIRG
jgi:hypothetical protein